MRKIMVRVSLLILLVTYILNITPVFAIQYTEVNITGTTKVGYNIRSGPGGTYSISGFTLAGQKHTITRYAITDDKSTVCESDVWFYVPTLSGWVCSIGYNLTTDHTPVMGASDMAKLDDKGFEAYLLTEGFPASYWPALKELHKKYPNWVFKAVNTYRLWDSSVRDQSVVGTSTYYIDSAREAAGHEAYLNIDYYNYDSSKDKHRGYDWKIDIFWPEDGSFYLANKDAVAYFLDPRNFLTEASIFMFENQLYNENSQASQLITSILGTNIYTDKLITIGKELNISPVALATRIAQEGTIGRRVTTGNIDVKCNGTAYSETGSTTYKAPLYNFYNIGAFTSQSNADLNGLCYAAQPNASNLRAWNTVDKALKGGAMFIGNEYILAGQYTTYFQKFNVSPVATKALGHQYMTNIEDPKSSSSIVYNRYKNFNALNSDFVFYIPYYLDMPASAVKSPVLGNPNNWLSSIQVGGNAIKDITKDKTSYTVNIGNVSSIKIDAITAAKTSYLTINGGSKALKTGSATINTPNNETVAKIVVTAANNTTKTYTITLKKDGTDTTPSEPEVKPPINNEPSVSKMISDSNLIYKDDYLNGIKVGTTIEQLTATLLLRNDKAVISYKNAAGKAKTKGVIVTGDVMTIKSNNETKTIELIIYGDVNGDGKITISDLLSVQKHILGDVKLKGAYLKAADSEKDGKVTIKDLLLIQKDILGDINIKQL